jgi:putative ABC transport system permease protein
MAYQGLKGSRSSAGLAERRLASVATLQMVLTVSLLAGAALLVRTAHNLDRVQPGYDTEHLLAMTVTTVQREQWKAFHTQALEHVARVPGVARAAFAWGVPLTGNKWPADIEIPGIPGSSALADRISLPVRAVTPEDFEALQIPLVDGRGFRHGDDGEAARVAIVNGAFGRQHFGSGHPVGRQMGFAGADRLIEIVGVIADTRTHGLHRAPAPSSTCCRSRSRRARRRSRSARRSARSGIRWSAWCSAGGRG